MAVLTEFYIQCTKNKIWSKEVKFLWAGYLKNEGSRLPMLPKDIIRAIAKLLFDEARAAVLES
jgi:hypothetical protein